MKNLISMACALAVCGCSTTPTSIVSLPTTVRPTAATAPVAVNGTIYQAASYRPLFEDRRARFVGDLVTISIDENTQAAKQASSNGAKNGSADVSISSVTNLPLKALQGLGITSSTKTANDDKSEANSSNSFTGNVTVTVIEVLPNGNLLVAGEKQIALDKGTEYIRLSGVVQPDTLLAGNTVSSTKVADARIEYRTSTHYDQAELMNWLGRFFLSIIPL